MVDSYGKLVGKYMDAMGNVYRFLGLYVKSCLEMGSTHHLSCSEPPQKTMWSQDDPPKMLTV